MAMKTITIDMAACEILVRARRGTESFSKVIKHRLAGAGNTAAERPGEYRWLYIGLH